MKRREEARQVKLIAMDIDGTLLNSHKQVMPKTKEILEKAAAQGIHIVAATGRAFTALPTAVSKWGIMEYVITSNGSSLFSLKDQMRVYGRDMERRTVEELTELLFSCPCPVEVFMEGQAYASRSYVENPGAYRVSPESAAYVQKTRKPVKDIKGFIRENLGRIEGMDLVVSDPELKRELRSRAEQIPDLYVTSSLDRYLEFGPAGAGKGRTLEELLLRLGLKKEHMIAFGDGENDREMLEAAGLGVAMANGNPVLKAVADTVTASNDEEGIWEILKEYL